MELQWPLILFTTLLAWAAGLFAAQCVWALRGKGARAQMPALIIDEKAVSFGRDLSVDEIKEILKKYR